MKDTRMKLKVKYKGQWYKAEVAPYSPYRWTLYSFSKWTNPITMDEIEEVKTDDDTV